MIVRRTSVLAALALVLLTTGCAVGDFITGAPSTRSMTPARALLVRRCSGCHAVPDPAELSGAEWKAGLEKMKLRMRLPASDWDSLAAMPTADVHR